MEKIKEQQKINLILDFMQIRAIIFDLDGTLIDNNAFHLRSWKKYLELIGRDISEEDYLKNINGRTNKDAVEYIYGRKMEEAEAMNYALKKEAIYREIYAPSIAPIKGLIPLLEFLYEKKLPMAIATSGIQVNIDFMFDHIPIRQFFLVIVNSSHIQKGKPDPEIYLQAAEKLKVETKHCLVFEDAVVGVKAAHRAGMRVIAVTSTHSREELSEAELAISDYTELL